MSILFFSGDLLFSSRVAGAAARLGMSLRTAASAAALVALLAEADARPLVILDLNSAEVDPARLVPALRGAANAPRAIVAYGPHVQEVRLAAATTAGCDQVLTRGQFNARLDEVLRSFGE